MGQIASADRRELAVLGAAMAVAFALVVAYAVATRGQPLTGDQPEYHMQGAFFTEGKLWWSETPFGEPHASAWKAPGYPAWVGLWYSILGVSALRVELVQALLAPLTVLLTWLLAGRLFGRRVALASACVVAAFPLVWEYFGMLFPEALAIPLTLAVLLVFLDREPTHGRVLAAGALIGVSLLVRPTAFFLLAGVAAAWIVTAGWRRGVVASLAVAVVAALFVAPWTVRNFVVTDGGFIPISVQDAAAYGTFNEEAANDPDAPFAWRPVPAGVEDYVDLSEPLDDATFRSRLQQMATDYIRGDPLAVPQAVFWNGIVRFWDLRSPSASLAEVDFQGRSRAVRAVGLGLYYVLLPLALIGAWRIRGRREIVVPLIAMAIVVTLAFTTVAGTRYRAPIEPVIAIMAAVAVLGPGRRAAPPDPS